MERKIKITEKVNELVSRKTYTGRRNQAEVSLETLKNEIGELMRVDIKERNWKVMTEEEFNLHHQENIDNEKCSLIIADEIGRFGTAFLFAEGTEL